MIKHALFQPLFHTLKLTCLMALALNADANRLLYSDVPVKLAIPVNHEIVLRLPQACAVGLPAELSSTLRVESAGSVLLLKATAAFESTRIVLRGLNSNRIYLVDVSAAEKSATADVELIDANLHSPTLTEPVAAADTIDPRVALVRYAAREFYAPTRLRGGIAAVRVPVATTPVHLYRGGSVTTTPAASWQYQGIYLTAIKVRNTTPDARGLDPRLLRGEWLAASAQHNVLAPAGQDGDLTMLYLLSTQPFEVTL